MTNPCLTTFENSKISIIDGDRGDNYPNKSEFYSNGYCLFLNTGNVTKNGFDFKNLDFIDEEKDKKLKKGKVQVGDIVLTTRGTVGNNAFVSEEIPYKHIRINSGMVILRVDPEKYDPYFIWVFLRSHLFQKQCLSQGSGSAQPQLPISALKNISFPNFKIEDQKSIAETIRLLDKKIELNTLINSELESIIKTLYNYWFVQFDFPDKDRKPYKASGGQMYLNANLKREIPKDWCDKTLDEAVLNIGTGLNPRNNFKLGSGENFYVTIKDIKQGKITFSENCDRINDEALAIINKRSDLKVGDILFTSIEPVGITYLIQDKPKNWNINESVFTIRAKSDVVTSEFLYMLVSAEEIKVFTKNSSAGSIHKGIRHSVLKRFFFPYCGINLIQRFTEIIEPFLLQQNQLDKQNLELINLRNFLIPMLMNGQIRVN